ncbi:MAG: hypothetical protein ABIH86_03895 [Planctomycetota bacterium]
MSATPEYKDCFVRVNDDGPFVIGNSAGCRTFHPVALLPAGRRPVDATPEGLPPVSEIAYAGLYGDAEPVLSDDYAPVVDPNPVIGIFEDPILQRGLQATIQIFSPANGAEILRDAIVFPGAAGIETRIRIRSLCAPRGDWSSRTRVDRLDYIAADLRGRRFDCYQFNCEPDGMSDILSVHSGVTPDNGEVIVNGSILIAQPLDETGGGFIIVKFGPDASSSGEAIQGDFIIRPNGVEVLGWGIAPWEIKPAWTTAVACAWIPFSGNRVSGLMALRRFLRRRSQSANRRSPSSSISPRSEATAAFRQSTSREFILRELNSASQYGADQYRTPIGWQVGRPLDLPLAGMVSPSFWEPDPGRFPEEIVRLALERDRVSISLSWIPNSNMQYSDWSVAAEHIVRVLDRLNATHLHIKKVRTQSRESAQNLELLIAEIIRQRPATRLSIDAIGRHSPGALSALAFGSVSLDVARAALRPCDSLRNAWKLAAVLPPNLIDVSPPPFPTHVADRPDRKRKLFTDQPSNSCLQQASYSPDYLAAIALFFAPKLRLTPSETSPALIPLIRDVMMLHQSIRDELHGGEILPFGDEPDGRSWSGFQSIDKFGSGYILVFRDNHPSAERILATPFLLAKRSTRIAGTGTVLSAHDFSFNVKLPNPRSWGLWKIFGME